MEKVIKPKKLDIVLNPEYGTKSPLIVSFEFNVKGGRIWVLKRPCNRTYTKKATDIVKFNKLQISFEPFFIPLLPNPILYPPELEIYSDLDVYKDLDDEIWEEVFDYGGIYQISNKGRVKSKRFNKDILLSPCGYRFKENVPLYKILTHEYRIVSISELFEKSLFKTIPNNLNFEENSTCNLFVEDIDNIDEVKVGIIFQKSFQTNNLNNYTVEILHLNNIFEMVIYEWDIDRDKYLFNNIETFYIKAKILKKRILSLDHLKITIKKINSLKDKSDQTENLRLKQILAYRSLQL